MTKINIEDSNIQLKMNMKKFYQLVKYYKKIK